MNNLPPGIGPHNIPGNTAEDTEWDILFEWLCNTGLTASEIRKAVEDKMSHHEDDKVRADLQKFRDLAVEFQGLIFLENGEMLTMKDAMNLLKMPAWQLRDHERELISKAKRNIGYE